jgi:hypothetical protein
MDILQTDRSFPGSAQSSYEGDCGMHAQPASVSFIKGKFAPILPSFAILSVPGKGAQSSPDLKRLDLQQCIKIAHQNNNRSRVSKDSIEMATAVHRQILSAWWPQVTGSVLGSRMDKDLNFIFPPSQISLPASAMTVTIPAVTLPANLFGPGLPAQNVSLPLPPATVNVPVRATIAGSLQLP